MREDKKSQPTFSGSARTLDDQSPSLVTAEDDVVSSESVLQTDSEDAEDEAPVRPVSHDMHGFIGRQLRAVYDDVAKQPVPDRFLELMRQLDSKTSVG